MLQIVSLFLFSQPLSSSGITNTYFYSGLAAQPVGSQFPDQDKTLMVEAWSLNRWTTRAFQPIHTLI